MNCSPHRSRCANRHARSSKHSGARGLLKFGRFVLFSYSFKIAKVERLGSNYSGVGWPASAPEGVNRRFARSESTHDKTIRSDLRDRAERASAHPSFVL